MANTPRAVPVQVPRRNLRRWILGGAGLALLALGLFAIFPAWERRERRSYKAALRDRAVLLTRWTAWLETGSCTRREDGTRWQVVLAQPFTDKASWEQLEDAVQTGEPVEGACHDALTALAADPGLPAAAHAVVHDWLAADDALDGPSRELVSRARGWREAHGAAAPSWQPVLNGLAARDRVLERARKDLLPAVRAAIRKVAAPHEQRSDPIWWQVQLGLLLEDVLDRGYAARRAHVDVAAEIAGPLRALQAKIAAAHDANASARDLPAIDALARASADAAWTALRAVEDNGEWVQIERDNSAFGPMPSEPAGCDRDE